MSKTNLKDWSIYLFLGLSALGYYLIGYQIERHETLPLLATYLTIFAVYIWILRSKNTDLNFKKLLVGGIIFRLVLLVSFPTLSDDIYRFIWDGRLLVQDIHPFSQLPSFYIQGDTKVEGVTVELFKLLNSPDYFTIYPPFAQFIFWIAAVFSDEYLVSAIIIRFFIILAELGTVVLILKLLERYSINRKRVLIYALNPLIIIELTGNLHFEAFMIFFLLLALYCLHHNAIVKASFFMALSVAVKLLPLMVLPIFIRRLKWSPLLKFYGLTGLFIVLLFLPLFNVELITAMSKSVGLYFQKFEFNASVYYIIREIGFWIKGYNIIGTAGKVMAIITFLTIVIISSLKPKQNDLFKYFLAVFTLYFFMTTTVHPWYIATILALSVFTQYRFPIVWSLLIFFTYAGYHVDGFNESYAIVIVEYVMVFTLIIFELYRYENKKKTSLLP